MRLFCFIFFLSVTISSNAQRLVLPGDHPDPSVVKIGNAYWAAGTTSNWFPGLRLYRSTDLIHWKTEGHVFTKKPDWVECYMWAPEISYDKGKVYVYYTARKKEGSLCIAAAVADQPQGPYRDLGPLVCQEDGSIDAFPMRDENGKLYLIWKEDGNSVGKPTPIWAAAMKEDRTALIGEKKELFRADMPWERGLVEGVSVMKRNNYFYAFYAGAACCGRTCSYGTGIARAKTLLGPWEKYPGNPVLTDNADWKCQGHGTPVEKNGRYYFLYHAYNTGSGPYTGRQGLLNEFNFTSDGWPQFLNSRNGDTVTVPKKITDHFSTPTLADNLHWSIFKEVHYAIKDNTLKLQALPSVGGAYLGQSVLTSNYESQVAVLRTSSSEAGLGLIGDDKNMLYAFVTRNSIRLVQLKKGQEQVIAEKSIRMPPVLIVKVKVVNNTEVTFMYSEDGITDKVLNDTKADAAYLPPWDRGIRVGLISKGDPGKAAFFRNFILKNH